jgi:hypothetical protein
MTLRSQLANLLGIALEDVDTAIRSDQAARRVIERRGFLGAAMALVAAPVLPLDPVNRVFSFAKPLVTELTLLDARGVLLECARWNVLLDEFEANAILREWHEYWGISA